MQTTTYRSTDGGKNFVAYKGAPGGDDYHVLWIDPQNSATHDSRRRSRRHHQRRWRPHLEQSWYNQPTGQFYHVFTDNQFPYISYAAQQDSGTAAVPNRSDWGEISFRDWFSGGGFEYCYIAPDPLNPNIIYSGGWYGTVVRFDKVTGQIVHVFVHGLKDRVSQMPPLVFSPQDPHTLFLGAQYVMKTTNAGVTWTQISPDLTVPAAAPGQPPAQPSAEPHSESIAPATAAAQSANGHSPLAEGEEPVDLDERDAGGKDDFELAQRPRRNALSVLTPSPLTASVLWSGATNGIIQTTRDASQTWQDVTPADLPKDSEIESIDASHFDANTAYVALEARLDSHPYIFRTRDSGKSWQKITTGLLPNWIARVVREDPVRQGLLYAGTENALYVSFDDGDHWQSLQLNFPASDVRDLAVHGDDLVAATYGRALWILDDLTPLRQAMPEISTAAAYLFKPANAIRVRYDNDQETPLPPEEPTAKNPPDGAIIDYYLNSVPANPLTLEIHDAQGKVVRRFTSLTPPADTTPKNVPDYWFGPQTQLSKNIGMNRFVWDLRYDPPQALNFSYYGGMLDYIEYTLSDHALPADTPREQTLGPLAVPGQYEIILIGNGSLMKQSLTITLDPRVHVSQADLDAQLLASKRIVSGLAASAEVFKSVGNLRAAIADRIKTFGSLPDEKPAEKNGATSAEKKEATAAAPPSATPPTSAITPETKASAKALLDLDKKVEAIQEGSFTAPGVGPVNRDLARVSFFVQSGDAAPTDTAKAAIDETCSALTKDIAAWHDLDSQEVPATNTIIAKSGLAPLPTATVMSITAAPQPAPDAADACHP